MIPRTLSGIPFLIHSPSHYEVAALDDGSDIASAALIFDGEWWVLRVLMKRGHTVTREFVSLAAALSLLSSRRAA
jgi:hypothetical protein